MTNEEKLQYAKDNYPLGTIFISCFVGSNGEQQIGESKGDFKYYGDDIICRITKEPFSGWITVYNSVQDKWAEITPNKKPFHAGEILNKEKSSFHTGEYVKDNYVSNITHEEATAFIQRLIDVDAPLQALKDNGLAKLEYIKTQLKQCEVLDEPVDMQVSNEKIVWFNRKVHGKFKGRYLFEKNEFNYGIVNYIRPIKKEPLSFTEWQEKEYNFLRNNDGCLGLSDPTLNKSVLKYTEYIKDFEDGK